MKFGKIAGAALLIVLIAYAGLTLYGTQPPLVAGIGFFTVTVILSLIVAVIYRASVKGEFLFFIFETVVLCAAFAFILGSAMLYQQETAANTETIVDISTELDYIAGMNDYYSGYLDYLREEVSTYQLNNANLEGQIAAEQSNLKAIANQQIAIPEPPVVEPVVPAEEPVVVYVQAYEDDEHEKEDREEEEEDD